MRQNVTSLIVTLLFIIGLAIPLRHNFAHEAPEGWAYSPLCCSNQDCAPVEPEAVTLTPDGNAWHVQVGSLDTLVEVDGDRIRQSQDDHFHACINERLEGYTPYPYLKCLYVPKARF